MAKSEQVNKPRAWYKSFIASLEEEPNISQACKNAGISRSGAYKAKREDDEFSTAWDDVIEASIDRLEVAAHHRALEGSDYLMNILLRAHRPEKYTEKKQLEHSGPDGGSLTIELIDRVLADAKD